MKRLIILSSSLLLTLGAVRGARVEVNPGELADYIATISADVTNLKVVGRIDARDLGALRDLPEGVLDLNLQEATVAPYSGSVEAFPGRERFAADELPAGLFYQTSFRSIWLPSGITRMGEALCAGSDRLEEIGLSDGTTELSAYALNGCTALTAVYLPSSLRTVGRYSFAGCASLETVSMEQTRVSFLDDALFKGCAALTSVSLPAGVTGLGSEVFAGSGVTELTLPALERAAAYALAGMPALESVTVSPHAAYGVGFLADNPSLRSVTGSPAAIPDLFLANSPTLDPSSVLKGKESSGAYAFADNAVRTLYLGGDITFIDEGSFAAAEELRGIDASQLGERLPEVAENAFSRIDPSKVALGVTEESLPLWKAHPVWGLFNVTTGDIGVADLQAASDIRIGVRGGVLTVSAPAGIRLCEVFGQDGIRLAAVRDAASDHTLDLSEIPGKTIVVRVESADGSSRIFKTLVR